MTLLRSSIVKEKKKRFVELTFATDDSDDPEEYAYIRTATDTDENSRFVEAELDGLRRVRTVIDREIERLLPLAGKRG